MSWYEPHPFPRFRDYAPSIAIPSVYWDVESAEQRVRAICEILGRVVAYADEMGIEVTRISELLAEIEAGHLDPMIEAAIEEWFNENEPDIMRVLNKLVDALPLEDFRPDHTVSDALDAISADISSILANGWVTTNRIANAAVTTPKIADGAITRAKLATPINMLVFGDSFSVTPQSDTPLWWTIVANRLKMNPKSFAVSGAGMNVSGNMIITQVQNAVADTTVIADNIELIFVYSGCNDAKNTNNISDIRTEQLAVADYIAANFPNSRVVFAANNWGWSRYRDQSATYNNVFANEIAESMVSVAQLKGMEGYNTSAYLMMYYAEDALFKDNHHPTATCEKLIASMFLGLLGGGLKPHSLYGTHTITSECVITGTYTGTITVAINANGGIVVNVSGFDASETVTVKIPFCLPLMNVPMRSAAGEVAGYLNNNQSAPNVLQLHKIADTGTATLINTYFPYGIN